MAIRCEPYRNSSYRHPVDGHIEGAPDTGSLFNPHKPSSKEGQKDIAGQQEEPFGSLSMLL